MTGTYSLKLSAWSTWHGSEDTLLCNATTLGEVHYDRSYTQVRWDMSVVPLGAPGTARITVRPHGAVSAALVHATDYMWWFKWKFNGYDSDKDDRLPLFEEDNAAINLRIPPPSTDLSFSQPGIRFIGAFGSFSNGGFVSYRVPWVNPLKDPAGYRFQPFAIIIPYQNGTVPPLPVNFAGGSVVLPPIPGDLRLALRPQALGTGGGSEVTMFDGGTLSFRMQWPDSTYSPYAAVEVELPECVTLLPASSGQVAYSTTLVPGAQAGMHRQRLVPIRGTIWASGNRNLQIWPTITCATPSAYPQARIRAIKDMARAGDAGWQLLSLKVAAAPVAPAVAPKLLAPSLTWATTNYFTANGSNTAHSLRMFRATGLTVVPSFAAEDADPRIPGQTMFYSPHQRATLQEWQGLQYGPQISSFYHSYKGPGMYTVLAMTWEQQQKLAPQLVSKYNLTAAEAAAEMQTWTNALAFYNATGHIDPACVTPFRTTPAHHIVARVD